MSTKTSLNKTNEEALRISEMIKGTKFFNGMSRIRLTSGEFISKCIVIVYYSDNDEEKNLVDDEIISTEQSKTEETVTLADVVRRREEADLYVVNIDSDLTLTIKEYNSLH